MFQAYGGLSLQKFRSQWQYWVTDTESKLATGCMAAEPELEEILKVSFFLAIRVAIHNKTIYTYLVGQRQYGCLAGTCPRC